MKTSETITKIAPAFLAAQKNIGAALKGQKNPFFKSTYADLGDVMEACKDQLNEQGICVLQPVSTDGDATYVETILLHESGEYISDRMKVVVKEANNPQAQGSAITYARRYSLQSLVFIPAEDDDGNKASTAPKSSQNGHSVPQTSIATNKTSDKKGTSSSSSGDVPSQSALKKEFEGLGLLAQDNTLVQWPQFVAKALDLKVKDVARLLQAGDLNYGECEKVFALLQQYRNNVKQSQANVA